MKAYFLWSVTGPQVILTSCDLAIHEDCQKMVSDSGIKKFVAQEISIDTVQQRYGEHYDAVINDPKQKDELRVLDTDGDHVLGFFSFKELGMPIYFE